jgi:hypothetical protein
MLAELLAGHEHIATGHLDELIGLAHRHPDEAAVRAQAVAALDLALGLARSGEFQSGFVPLAPLLRQLTILHLAHVDDLALRHALVRNLFAVAAADRGVTSVQRRNAYHHLERLAVLHPSDATTFSLYSVLRDQREDLGLH